MAVSRGGIYKPAISVKMGKDLSDFDKGQNVMATSGSEHLQNNRSSGVFPVMGAQGSLMHVGREG